MPQVSDLTPIAIIGAGLGGLTAALAMLKLGVPVRVYEQAPELGEVGAGITIQPNASRVLEYLGLGPAMDQWAVEPKSIGARHYRTGEILSIRDGVTLRDSLGSRYCFMHRADMHQMLTDAVRAIDPECVVLDHRVSRVENRERSAVAHFENGAAIEAAAVIGADGIHSVVRAQLWGKDNPTFAERVAWRALVPYDSLPEHVMTPESAAIRGPDRFIVRYPVRARQLVNYVATMRYTGEWRVESWRERAEVSDVLDAFAGWDDCALDLLRATPPDGCYKWAIFAREPLQRWTDGHITLLGDAAHASQPYLGQGAAMAIEDAMVLARSLTMPGSVAEALQRYERARLPRANWLQEASRLNGERMVTSPDTQTVQSQQDERAAMAQSRDYDAVTVPIL